MFFAQVVAPETSSLPAAPKAEPIIALTYIEATILNSSECITPLKPFSKPARVSVTNPPVVSAAPIAILPASVINLVFSLTLFLTGLKVLVIPLVSLRTTFLALPKVRVRVAFLNFFFIRLNQPIRQRTFQQVALRAYAQVLSQ